MAEALPGVITVHCFYGCGHIEVTSDTRSNAMERHYKTAHAGQLDPFVFPRRKP